MTKCQNEFLIFRPNTVDVRKGIAKILSPPVISHRRLFFGNLVGDPVVSVGVTD